MPTLDLAQNPVNLTIAEVAPAGELGGDVDQERVALRRRERRRRGASGAGDRNARARRRASRRGRRGVKASTCAALATSTRPFQPECRAFRRRSRSRAGALPRRPQIRYR
jgi:hypothetical protein